MKSCSVVPVPCGPETVSTNHACCVEVVQPVEQFPRHLPWVVWVECLARQPKWQNNNYKSYKYKAEHTFILAHLAYVLLALGMLVEHVIA